jgi:hypothetical protein
MTTKDRGGEKRESEYLLVFLNKEQKPETRKKDVCFVNQTDIEIAFCTNIVTRVTLLIRKKKIN